ncbi:MAG: helix-hairpin-helix domain-containing protein [Hyphomicrobiaceae bacterium]|nr:helix-hairpin-helix domain-containing protein [Hyphomicrobiaceae bacterium]
MTADASPGPWQALALNHDIAAKLREMADLLAAQQADGYRIAAYRRAASAIDALTVSVDAIAREKGLAGLVELPAIGQGIGGAIMEMIATGRWTALERLNGQIEPERLFRTLPGVGPDLAHRIHDALHIDTLEGLELALHDGRFEGIAGFGERRIAALRAEVAERLGHRRIRAPASPASPSVAILLDVDREYREKAASGELRKIAPRRFNPSGAAWLPVLHAQRSGWSLTLLYSNTQRAHDLGRTQDWVVAYYHEAGGPESQCTIVTETRGPLAGRRVVRGREGDCIAHYAAIDSGRGGDDVTPT